MNAVAVARELLELAGKSAFGPWDFSRESWNVRQREGDADISVYEPECDEDMTGEFIAACSPDRITELCTALIAADEREKRLHEALLTALEHANFVDTAEGRDRSNIGGIRGCLLVVRDVLQECLAAPLPGDTPRG